MSNSEITAAIEAANATNVTILDDIRQKSSANSNYTPLRSEPENPWAR
jgi:hypothetical protein